VTFEANLWAKDDGDQAIPPLAMTLKAPRGGVHLSLGWSSGPAVSFGSGHHILPISPPTVLDNVETIVELAHPAGAFVLREPLPGAGDR
jgi:hypothetical protein